MQVSVVVPVYGSASILPSLAERVRNALTPAYPKFELILVNDCSPDESWKVIESLSRLHPFLVGIDLRRNVGQDNAIMAGLNAARGEVVVIMDDDLQHSPEDIPRLCAQVNVENDVCYACFEKKKQAGWKNAGSWLNGKLADWVIGKPSHIYLSPFKAITQGVVREMISYRGPFPYIDGLIWGVTMRCTQIDAIHNSRASGKGNYDLVKSIRVWLKLFTGFSVRPLRLITMVGFATSILSFLAGLAFIIAHFFESVHVEGWASLFVSVSFLSGVQLICLGMLGEYIGRTYLRLSEQPQFSVHRMLKSKDEFKDESED